MTAGIEFEWDPAKAASNLNKHGIDFVDTANVFSDPRDLVRVARRCHGETRM
jgi:uncharacterized protein